MTRHGRARLDRTGLDRIGFGSRGCPLQQNVDVSRYILSIVIVFDDLARGWIQLMAAVHALIFLSFAVCVNWSKIKEKYESWRLQRSEFRLDRNAGNAGVVDAV